MSEASRRGEPACREHARGVAALPVGVQLVIAAFSVAFAAGLIAAGMGLFILSSGACGLAPDALMLVAARTVQRRAAALVAPQVLAIITTL